MSTVGSRLTTLSVKMSPLLNMALIYGNCLNIQHLSLDTVRVRSGSYEDVEGFRNTAMKNLITVKIRCIMPTDYIDIILKNSKSLQK